MVKSLHAILLPFIVLFSEVYSTSMKQKPKYWINIQHKKQISSQNKYDYFYVAG